MPGLLRGALLMDTQDNNPGVQGLAQLGRNAIERVSELEAEVFRLRESLAAIVNRCEGSAVRIARAALTKDQK